MLLERKKRHEENICKIMGTLSLFGKIILFDMTVDVCVPLVVIVGLRLCGVVKVRVKGNLRTEPGSKKIVGLGGEGRARSPL